MADTLNLITSPATAFLLGDKIPINERGVVEFRCQVVPDWQMVSNHLGTLPVSVVIDVRNREGANYDGVIIPNADDTMPIALKSYTIDEVMAIVHQAALKAGDQRGNDKITSMVDSMSGTKAADSEQVGSAEKTQEITAADDSNASAREDSTAEDSQWKGVATSI